MFLFEIELCDDKILSIFSMYTIARRQISFLREKWACNAGGIIPCVAELCLERLIMWNCIMLIYWPLVQARSSSFHSELGCAQIGKAVNNELSSHLKQNNTSVRNDFIFPQRNNINQARWLCWHYAFQWIFLAQMTQLITLNWVSLK